ncbi:LLM class F420-dependent oxidoreductase [Amycolatopsis sp. NPDC059657]|uniref:LLM class F420-dependent oxidoreductase n=1 Tax=Amycolatopsis sp. NPDC059657 TaxID=3346899 RepID=UPI00366B0239
MKYAVTLGLWQDRAPEEALATARAAEAAGYDELWIGEMATWDVFALATAIGTAAPKLDLTLGPLPVTVRDPTMIAMGTASVAALTGRRVDVALGTSSDVVVRDWHGRSRRGSSAALGESAQVVRELLDGKKAASGYRLRLAPPRSTVTIAAFGPAAVEAAAAHADRMVVNLVSPAMAGRLVEDLREAARRLGKPPPRVAAWVVGALNPKPAALDQLRRGIVGYLAAPGYSDMFRAEGFGALVDFALTRPHPRELLEVIDVSLIQAIGLVGDLAHVRDQAAAYAEAGVDEIAIVPACTDDDPGGALTLRGLRDLA